MCKEIAQIKFDFHADFMEIIKSNLQASNFEIAKDSTDRDIVISYLNFLRRRIIPAPREVEISKEFSCPLALQAAFEEFSMRSRRGDDLRAYHSTGIKKLDVKDPLLNDWGIYHFHLGIATRNDDFVERTCPVLFAWVTDSKIYAIAIMEHGSSVAREHSPWTNKDLLEILHNNWPNLIEHWRAKDIIDIEFDANSEELKKLRKAGFNTFIKLPDASIYMPPGGGYMTSGDSMEVVRLSHQYLRLVSNIEKHFEDNEKTIVANLLKNGVPKNETLFIKLISIETDCAIFKEIVSGFDFSIPINCPDN